MSSLPTLSLNNGPAIPQLGFGVFQIPQDEVEAAVTTALDAGYRLIDTAAVYRNEKGVGDALASSDVPRDDLFITTKVWNSDQGHDETLRAFDASMGKLRLDVLDLYLIHWPTPARDLYLDTWKALESLYREGRIRSIGVSNFPVKHLRRLIDSTEVVPSVNQVELHPWLPQTELRAFHAERGILTEAWSPIGQGHGLLDDPTIGAVASSYGVSPAQVVLRWHLQHGIVAIPKSVTPSRIRENIDLFGFELSREDMAAIDGLESGRRLGPDPEHMNAA